MLLKILAMVDSTHIYKHPHNQETCHDQASTTSKAMWYYGPLQAAACAPSIDIAFTMYFNFEYVKRITHSYLQIQQKRFEEPNDHKVVSLKISTSILRIQY